jgi:tRNA(fMet)-specific endonuclease VapC
MGIILDTNVFIAAERFRRSGSLTDLTSQIPLHLAQGEALISVITASELLIGVHRAKTPKIRARRQTFVDEILDQFNSIPIDLRVAREHSRLTASLISRGTKIGTHDSWIAATAVAFDHAIMTANQKEFNRIEGLTVIPTEG